MRIAIATDDGTQVAPHTGRCDGFVIFEVSDGEASRYGYRPNRFTAHHRGQCTQAASQTEHTHSESAGSRSHAPLLDAIRDCCALVARGMGPRLANELAAEGIDAFVCTVPTVDVAAQQFAQGRLPRIEGAGRCQHG